MAASICWGIEIGGCAIKALKLQAEGDAIRVLDFAILPHKRVLSTPGIDPNDVLRLSLVELAARCDIASAPVAMSVPGHAAFARFAKLPPVERRKVPDIVKFEAVQQIPFPIEEVEWDYQTFASPDSPDVEVGIFAMTRARIEERLHQYAEIGLTPDVLTLSPAAVYNALAYDLAFTERTPGTIIVDIGTTSTDLIVAESGRVWMRTFPVGGHHFTEALVNAFQVSYPRAEQIKRDAESGKHARHVFQAMRPVFSDLAQDVQRSIGYYQSLHREAKLERLIGLGSTFRLPGLRKYLKQQVQIEVYRMEQFKRLGVDGPRAAEFQAATLNLATAYGLALQGLGLATLEANLMPTAVLRTAMWRRKTPYFVAAAALGVAAGAAMFIRPFLDDQAVSANPPDRIVESARRDVVRLKQEAQPATEPALGTSTAAEVLALLDRRDIYPHLVRDLGQMFAVADARAERSAALALKALRTSFVPPRGDGSAPGSEGQSGPEAGRLRVALTVTTTLPDAQRFVIETLQRWLQDNARRPDVPYEIVFEGARREAVATMSPTEPRAGGSPPAGAPAPGPLAAGGRERPGLVPIRSGEQPILMGGGPTEEGGASASGPMEPLQRPAGTGTQALRQLAPLPVPPPEPGTVTTMVVTWSLVLRGPAAPAAGGAS